jgi:8-oxo-dGTP pyrophosphatase MutT (NUDIX family)
VAEDRTVRAAGGVVWRPRQDGDGVEVALVHRPRYDDWSLPKGKLEPGEQWVAGARREVLEETGLRVVAGRRLGESRYRAVAGGREVRKRVRWWSLRAVDGDFAPSDEVDVLRWLPPDRALEALSAGYDAEPLRQFTTEPPLTTTLLLVRHGRAGSREQWDGDDDARPLDDKGRAQAEALARLLPAYDPERPAVGPAAALPRHPGAAGGLVRHRRRARPAAGRDRLRAGGRAHPRAAAGAGRRRDARPRRRRLHPGRGAARGAGGAGARGQGAAAVGPQGAQGQRVGAVVRPDGCLVDADLTADPLD